MINCKNIESDVVEHFQDRQNRFQSGGCGGGRGRGWMLSADHPSKK